MAATTRQQIGNICARLAKWCVVIAILALLWQGIFSLCLTSDPALQPWGLTREIGKAQVPLGIGALGGVLTVIFALLERYYKQRAGEIMYADE